MTERAAHKDVGGNGGSTTHVRDRIVEVGERADDLAKSVRTTTNEAKVALDREMKAHPYRMVSIAAALGFVLGGGLSLALLRTATSIGARLAVGSIVSRLTNPER